MIVLRDKETIDQGTVMAEGHVTAADLQAALGDEGYVGLSVAHVTHLWVIEVKNEYGLSEYKDVSQHAQGATPVTVGRLTRRPE